MKTIHTFTRNAPLKALKVNSDETHYSIGEFTTTFDEHIQHAGNVPDSPAIISCLEIEVPIIQFHEFTGIFFNGHCQVNEGKVNLMNVSDRNSIINLSQLFYSLGAIADSEINQITSEIKLFLRHYEVEKSNIITDANTWIFDEFLNLLSAIEKCSQEILATENDLLLINNNLSLRIK